VGCLHSFSAGLVIGGKDVDEEKTRISGMNILICTPGRLLQHLDETVGFDASTLQVASAVAIAADSQTLPNSLVPPPTPHQVLVLDEADRILDMGFDRELRAIVQSLPDTRQTLLFSATLTKSVRALAQLSLKSPEYTALPTPKYFAGFVH
jgi:ATP-dependent RNA helicase DDX10/DBP4